MAAKRKTPRKRIKTRNPYAPLLRALRPKVKPSKRTYKRKPKHKDKMPTEDA